jgi:hypothetical protein
VESEARRARNEAKPERAKHDAYRHEPHPEPSRRRHRYVYDRHHYEAETKHIMETVASRLVALAEGRPDDNVVPIERTGAQREFAVSGGTLRIFGGRNS